MPEADRPGQNLAAFLEGRAPPDLAQVITALAEAAIPIAMRIRRGPFAASPLAAAVSANPGGPAQMALDVFADEAFEQRLRGASVRGLVSPRRDAPAEIERRGRFLVTLEPLDETSNIAVNVTIGSIFSVLDAPDAASLDESAFLQSGHRQRAAGMIVYGPHTDLIVTLGAGTHVATLDPETQTFRMIQLHLDIPEGSAELAVNASNVQHWPGPVRAYVEDCLMGEQGPRAKDFHMRWIGSLVADAYRVLRRGGAYLYPEDARAAYAQGRLRLLPEANPIALLVEQAGGLAIDGVNRILDLPAKSLDARTPLIFGSTDKVERIRGYYVEEHRSAARAPLFGKRGLLRG